MSEEQRQRWNDRYRTGDYRPRSWPSPLLEEWLPHLPVGRALVLACGAGRNALRLAEAGFAVDAVDISAEALARGAEESRRRGLDVNWIEADLDEATLPGAGYQLITAIRYVNRPLFARVGGALARDGWVIAEHHMTTDRAVSGPTDPAFRLRPQELLNTFAGLRIMHFSETVGPDRDGETYALQRLVACAGDPGW